MKEFLSRDVKQIINDVGDEIEFEIIRYSDHYSVVATICQNEPPFKDCIGIGKDRLSRKRATRKALNELYLQAYCNETTSS